jgi:hypothetical protein
LRGGEPGSGGVMQGSPFADVKCGVVESGMNPPEKQQQFRV